MSVLGIPGSETSNPVSTGWGTTAAPGACHAERSACTAGDGSDREAVADREARVSVVGEQAQFVRPRGERRDRKGHAATRRARRVSPPQRWRVGSARRVNSNPVGSGRGTNAVPGGRHRTTGGNARWARTKGSARAADDGRNGETVADREARGSVVGEQAQLVCSRGERGRDRKGQAAACRARGVTPRNGRRVGSARRVKSNPVGSGRGTNGAPAGPGGRHRATGSDACRAGGEATDVTGGNRETVADREARVSVVGEQAQLVRPRRDRGRERQGRAAARRPRRVTPTQVVGGVGGARHKDSDPVFWGRRRDAGPACRDGGTGRDGRRACGKSCGRHRNPAHAFRCSASIGKGDASRKIARGSRTEANRYRRACASHQVIRAS